MKFVLFLLTMSFSCSLFAEKSTDSFIRFNGFELEKTQLSDVIDSVGETEIHKDGDAGESYTGICYYYPNEDITIFYESGELGGSKTLLTYKVVKGHKAKFKCLKIHETVTEFSISGLKIDLTLKDAIDFLPNMPYKVRGLSYIYWNKIPFNKDDYRRLNLKHEGNYVWDELVTIELYENNNLLTGYSVTRVITR